MFYIVRYVIQVGENTETHNSLFIHLTKDLARREAESKKFYGMYPVIDFYIDTLILNEEV